MARPACLQHWEKRLRGIMTDVQHIVIGLVAEEPSVWRLEKNLDPETEDDEDKDEDEDDDKEDDLGDDKNESENPTL